jgi:hypothetical protein
MLLRGKRRHATASRRSGGNSCKLRVAANDHGDDPIPSIAPLKRARAACALLLAICGVGAAFAQYPDRPVSLILPTPPGGAADLNARPLAKQKDAEAMVSRARKIAKVQ